MGTHSTGRWWALTDEDRAALYRVRGWLYRVTTAGAVFAAGYGIIEGNRLPLWIALAGAVFGNAVAAVNTPTAKP